MALILNNGVNYTDATGTVHAGNGTNTGPYLIVDLIRLDYLRDEVQLVIRIYASRNARVALKAGITRYDIVVIDPDFTTYFTTAKTVRQQARDYIVAQGFANVFTDLIASQWTLDTNPEP